jgi:hypothetical protein
LFSLDDRDDEEFERYLKNKDTGSKFQWDFRSVDLVKAQT